MTIEVRKWRPKTAEEIQAELTEMGFENLPKADWTATCEAMDEQIDNDTEIRNRVFDAVYDYYADNYEFHKDTYEEFMERWVAEKADALHDAREAEKEKADAVVINLQKRGMCPDGIARATYKTATRLACADGEDLKALNFHKREGYYLSAVFQIGAEILGN